MKTARLDSLEERLVRWPAAAAEPRLILFDIDRTLLDTCGGNRRAMERAGRTVFGERFDLEGIDRSGRLDSHILMDAAYRLGQHLLAEQFNQFRTQYAIELESELDGQRVMPGAVAWVKRLAEIENVTLGLVTGNFASAAAVKIPAIGLDFSVFKANGFGGTGERRADLVGIARLRCPQAKIESTLIIGDTPRDIECARANGCPSLIVATGDYDADQLREAGAEDVVSDLTSPEATRFMNLFLRGKEADA
ncbi:HAD family hydrolase [Algisphaera agarilytica]|uniref:phosphoglycolate phosphatase n=1 Tax=Algisphaera agarilytica TaxID=1385975 RepID=A0A7X0H8R2_9BACT|nr:HAD hydrolase-like protein [Algisphaera agarilytica]MBB6431367.1 phosphoglycolate phosphatase [Algisphaera agarilytica]